MPSAALRNPCTGECNSCTDCVFFMSLRYNNASKAKKGETAVKKAEAKREGAQKKSARGKAPQKGSEQKESLQKESKQKESCH